MNNKIKKLLVLSSILIIKISIAGEANNDVFQKTYTECDATIHHKLRADAHGPASIMGDHIHKKGTVMFGYRYMYMSMDKMLNGSDDISYSNIFSNGYMITPTSMETEMHMFSLMYGITENFVISVMSNYQLKSMKNLTKSGSMARMMRGKTFDMEIDGWGDTSIGVIYRIWKNQSNRLLLSLSSSMPTGKINDGYNPMQTSTGTWDLLPKITWIWKGQNISSGTQILGKVHIGENDSDYTFGNSANINSWLAYRLRDWVSLSLRLEGFWKDYVSEVESNKMVISPMIDPNNSGGKGINAGIGINLLSTKGPLKKTRLSAEYILPIFRDLNGIQPKLEHAFILAFKKSF